MILFQPGNKTDKFMMKTIFSDQISDFSSIHLDDVEVISIARPDFHIIEECSLQFLQTRKALKPQWEQDLEDDSYIQSALSESMPTTLKSMLINQINESGEMLGDLLGCKKVNIRLASLRSPMCPLFHVDNIKCRLLITLCGKGTEWIPNNSVDWKILSDLIDFGHFHICKKREFSREKKTNLALPTRFSNGMNPTVLSNLLS